MLHSKGGHAWHRTIRGIWVASDDPYVIDEVRQIYHLYFPYVEPELIVWVSDGVQGALETTGVATHSSRQVTKVQVDAPHHLSLFFFFLL